MSKLSRVVVIGGSAGGLDPLRTIVASLPDLPVSVFVVLHTSPKGPGALPDVLGRRTRIPVAFARDGERIVPRRIYVAPPDLHMLLSPEKVHLSRAGKENGFRPAVDPLFRTAAESFGERAIGVVLSGSLSDGAAGLRAIKNAGGYTLVQDPDEAPFQSMPASAMEMGPVDASLPAKEIAREIARIVRENREPPVDALADDLVGFNIHARTPPSGFTCPECGGALWVTEGGSPSFRCHVGHGYSMTRLMEAQDEEMERALWAAVRSLEESGSLARRLAERARTRGQDFTARHFQARAEDKEQNAEILQSLLTSTARQSKTSVKKRR